ncbi:DUF4442 domain-containing protein [Sinimarinibacterium sp. NLF-5-8]|uniref:DUF4442 domain-containing protein n=1 Tax=Sinimarinibacterium sp. NLF-5-8 TaxID=2698684 RepID=UPI00137C3087|nr:DUF4442 domain-containing protein [Sinimarinibacterium sp. NLF-5-8]QHS10862.1 DUF4442 domain-containing protein [Sinimarinibacterium sp. NLF-5-8]
MAKNTLNRVISVLDYLPGALAARAKTLIFTSQVRFAGTAGLRFAELTTARAVVDLRNRKKVQNHIGGVHAAATALLAETASGAVFGMNVRSDALPLLKSMTIEYLQRAQGSLQATATLDEAARAQLAEAPRGDLTVPVRIVDESGQEPVRATLVWAWVPKKKD